MKIILGNGLSAKIFSMYNPEYVRIAPEGGAQSDLSIFQHSLILPKCRVCDEFLEDLKLSSASLDIEIGYFANDQYHKGEPPEDVKRELIKNKLSGHERPPSLFPSEDILAGPYVTGDRGTMHTYELSAAALLEALDTVRNGRVNSDRYVSLEDGSILEPVPGPVRIGKAKSISDKCVSLEDGTVLAYSHLVSTIPADVFWKIYAGPYAEHKVLVSFPLYVGAMSLEQWLAFGYPELPDNAMVYFPESKYGFDRVRRSRSLQGDVVALEGSRFFQESWLIPGARMMRCWDNIAPPGVMFIGRYAEWNPDITMRDVIRRSSRKFFLESIFSDQKAFNKKFVTYAPDIENVQRTVKDYILHLFSESDSLLNTINWKVGSKPGEVALSRDNILEEWMDIFKFWLSIGHMFGFDTRDFEDMYWKKSAKIVEKYKSR